MKRKSYLISSPFRLLMFHVGVVLTHAIKYTDKYFVKGRFDSYKARQILIEYLNRGSSYNLTAC